MEQLLILLTKTIIRFGCMNSKTIQQVLFLSLLLLPVVSLAQFEPLVGIPGLDDPTTDINSYINILYALSISVAALLAVIKIIVAGVKYMLSDVVTSKSEAKSDIQGALIGLLVVISAVLILNVINPQLTQTTLFIPQASQVPFNNSAGSGSSGTAPAPAPTLQVLASGTTTSPCTSIAACSVHTRMCNTSGGRVSGGARTGSVVCYVPPQPAAAPTTPAPAPAPRQPEDVACTVRAGVVDCASERTRCESRGGQLRAGNDASRPELMVCFWP